MLEASFVFSQQTRSDVLAPFPWRKASFSVSFLNLCEQHFCYNMEERFQNVGSAHTHSQCSLSAGDYSVYSGAENENRQLDFLKRIVIVLCSLSEMPRSLTFKYTYCSLFI